MDKKTTGAWLVHHTHKLDNVRDSGKFKHIRIAGKSGILLSALSTSKDNSLENKRVQILAEAAGLDTTFELEPILKTLADNHLIERKKSGIEIIGLTTQVVLQNTADVFNALSPT